MTMNSSKNNNYLFANLLLFMVLAFFAAAIYWAWFAELDEVIRGPGRVIPSSQIKTIQNLEGGILSKVLVKEGQKIKAEQVLIHLDKTAFSASVDEKLAEKHSLEASIARLTAEYTNKPIHFPKRLKTARRELIDREISLMKSRAARLAADIDIQTQTQEKFRLDIKEKAGQLHHLKIDLKIANEKYNILKPLVEKQSASKIELLDLKRQVNQLESNIEDHTNQIPKSQAAIEMAESKKDSLKKNFSSSVLNDLSSKKNQLAQLEQILPAVKDRLKRTSIRSPVAGLVKRIFVHTIGGVVGPAEPLMEIVPQKDELLVEAKILPKDIGFIHPGQSVKVKFTAYDFSIYGGIDGVLEHISADAFVSEDGYSYFLIRVKLDQNHINHQSSKLPVMTGMDCQVDILSGSKTVMDYILKPILKARQTALQEP